MDKGTKVIFVEASNEQVRWGGNDDPRLLLKIGDTYTVKEVEVHSWHTKIYLEEVDGKFNSVHFKPDNIDTPIEDKQSDKSYCLVKINGGKECKTLCEGCFQLYKKYQPKEQVTNEEELNNWLRVEQKYLAEIEKLKSEDKLDKAFEELKIKISNCSNSTKESRARKGAYVDALLILKSTKV